MENAEPLLSLDRVGVLSYDGTMSTPIAPQVLNEERLTAWLVILFLQMSAAAEKQNPEAVNIAFPDGVAAALEYRGWLVQFNKDGAKGFAYTEEGIAWATEHASEWGIPLVETPE